MLKQNASSSQICRHLAPERLHDPVALLRRSTHSTHIYWLGCVKRDRCCRAGTGVGLLFSLQI